MSSQVNTLLSPAQRVGKRLGITLKHAVGEEVFAQFGGRDQMERNKGATTIYRRWIPKGGTAANPNVFYQDANGDRTVSFVNQHAISEGITPAAEQLIPQDIPATLVQYGVTYGTTDVVRDIYEDDIPREQLRMTGERVGVVREAIIYNALKGCTNVYYAGGSSRSTISSALTLGLLQRVAAQLLKNHAKPVREVLKGSQDFSTFPIEQAYIVVVNPDIEPDIRAMPGFISTAQYGTNKEPLKHEFGSVQRFRFIAHADIVPVENSGATGTSLKSTTGTFCDTYQSIVFAEDAYIQIALRMAKRGGKVSEPMEVIVVDNASASDPLNQRLYTSAKWWDAAVVTNSGWMAVVETGATNN